MVEQKTCCLINIDIPVGKMTSKRCLKDVKTSKTSYQDILQMSKKCLKRKSERHFCKTS